MNGTTFLRLKSLNTRSVRGVTSHKNIIRVAAMHNLREIQAELGVSAASSIDLARMHLNYVLRGPDTADGVAALALALLDNAGVKNLRKDACMAVELVFSLPPGSAVNHRDYFAAAVAWADAYFNVPIISAAVHMDESAPHMHVLMLPLVGGRMQGGALAGGRAKICAMLADFQKQVGQRFGLAHQPRSKRISKANMNSAGQMVLDALKARPERLDEPAVLAALVAALGQCYETLLPLLGLTLPVSAKAKAKTFAAIMTAPCKLEQAARARKSIDVAPSSTEPFPQNSTTSMLCIDVAQPCQAFSSTDHPVTASWPADQRQQAKRKRIAAMPSSTRGTPASHGKVQALSLAQPTQSEGTTSPGAPASADSSARIALMPSSAADQRQPAASAHNPLHARSVSAACQQTAQGDAANQQDSSASPAPCPLASPTRPCAKPGSAMHRPMLLKAASKCERLELRTSSALTLKCGAAQHLVGDAAAAAMAAKGPVVRRKSNSKSKPRKPCDAAAQKAAGQTQRYAWQRRRVLRDSRNTSLNLRNAVESSRLEKPCTSASGLSSVLQNGQMLFTAVTRSGGFSQASVTMRAFFAWARCYPECRRSSSANCGQ
jgi:hypothetical protein